MPPVVFHRHSKLLGILLVAFALVFSIAQPAPTAHADDLPEGWELRNVMAPHATGLKGEGPQLHVTPDGTIRYLGVTGSDGRSGTVKIWQRNAAGTVQEFNLPQGMYPTYDTLVFTFLGKPDSTGGYLVVQQNTRKDEHSFRAVYVPNGKDPSTLTGAVQQNVGDLTLDFFLSSPSGATAIIAPEGAGHVVLMRPAGTNTGFGAPVEVPGPGGVDLGPSLGGIIDPSGGVLVVSTLPSHGTSTLRTMSQVYIQPNGSVGAGGGPVELQRHDDRAYSPAFQASNNGTGLAVWDRVPDSTTDRMTWVSTRQPGKLLSAPVSLGNVSRGDSFPSGAIADDGSAVIYYQDEAQACGTGHQLSSITPKVATRASAGESWAKTNRGSADNVGFQSSWAESAGNKLGALVIDTKMGSNPCAGWSYSSSYRLGLSGTAQNLKAPFEFQTGGMDHFKTADFAMNSSGVAAAIVRSKMIGSNSANQTMLLTVNAPVVAPPLTLTTATPTISGTVKVGQTLTAKPGAWTSGTAFAYQWFASGTAISKAAKSTFKLTPAQAGKTITVKVTGSKAGYTTASKTSKATAKVANATLTTKTPTISGTAKVGKTLTAKPGTWTSGTKFTYQWSASGATIKGATKSTFKPTASHVGKTIKVKVTGTLSGYTTVSKTSKATAKVAKGTLTTKTPTISGTAKVGKTLTAKTGTCTSGTKFTYQWSASGATIKGAMKSTFKLTKSQQGKKITVKVTGKKSGYATASKTSKATSTVKK